MRIDPVVSSSPLIEVSGGFLPKNRVAPPARLTKKAAKKAAAKIPTPQRLASAWQHHLCAPVRSRHLAAAIDALIDHHLGNGFYGVRADDMRREKVAGPDGLEIAYAPKRNVGPFPKVKEGECILCQPNFKSERGLAWRHWKIYPNCSPYLATSTQHVVLTYGHHIGQSYSPQVLSDMIDFHAFARGGRPMTMHYNGIAGNSQAHLHWQAMREVTPLQRKLDAGELPLRPVVTQSCGHVSTYEQGFFAGILVEGSKAFVIDWATRIVRGYENDPVARGAYNMLMLPAKNGKVRLVIVGRRADNLRPQVGSFGRAGIGAFTQGGILVIPHDKVPDDFLATINGANRATTIAPSEIAWLSQLAGPTTVLHRSGSNRSRRAL